MQQLIFQDWENFSCCRLVLNDSSMCWPSRVSVCIEVCNPEMVIQKLPECLGKLLHLDSRSVDVGEANCYRMRRRLRTQVSKVIIHVPHFHPHTSIYVYLGMCYCFVLLEILVFFKIFYWGFFTPSNHHGVTAIKFSLSSSLAPNYKENPPRAHTLRRGYSLGW